MRAFLCFVFIYMVCVLFVVIDTTSSFMSKENHVIKNLLESVHSLKVKNIKLETETRTLSKTVDLIRQNYEKQNQILKEIKQSDPIVILELGHLPDMKIISGRSNSSDGTIYGFKVSEILSKSVLDVFYPTKELRTKIKLKIDRLKDLNEEGMVDRFNSTIQTFLGKLVVVRVVVLKTSEGFLVTTGENKHG